MVDKDGDGQVSFDEFYAMVTGGRKPPPGMSQASFAVYTAVGIALSLA
jgi:Ca2+-binding EF-hand superfamily protein